MKDFSTLEEAIVKDIEALSHYIDDQMGRLRSDLGAYVIEAIECSKNGKSPPVFAAMRATQELAAEALQASEALQPSPSLISEPVGGVREIMNKKRVCV